MISNYFITKAVIFYLLITIPAILAAIPFPTIPTIPSIQDEIFPEFPTNGQIPRISLTYAHGVPTLPFSIGTPSQNFVGIFDTSSPVTWVMSEKCNSSACLSVQNSQKYHPETSSTNFKFPFRIDLSYLDGSHVQLKPELDAITFDNKFTIPRHLVAEAYQVDYPKGYAPPANARLGMGDFGSIDWTKTKFNLDTSEILPTSLNSFPGFFRSRRAVGDDRYSTGYSNSGSPSFRKRGPLNDILSSFVFVLGVDKTLHKGPIYKLPLVPLAGLRSPFWKIPVNGFQLTYSNNTTTTELQQKDLQYTFPSGAYGKIDSSSPVLTVPSATADAMNKAIGAAFDTKFNLYTISCSAISTAPSLVVQFGAGLDARIPPQQYIYQIEGPTNSNEGCYTAIAGGTDSQNVYLGGPFFRSFYLVFHYSGLNVGIAESSSTELTGTVYVQSSSKQRGVIPTIIG